MLTQPKSQLRLCPECGKCTPMIHWRTQTSESVEFRSERPGLEIYQMFSRSDAALMVDSVLPADDRLTFPDAGQGPWQIRGSFSRGQVKTR